MRFLPSFRFGPALFMSLACAAALWPSHAHAGPKEWLAQVEIDPANPCRFALRYTNGRGGLLFSEDAGRSFYDRCSSSFDEQDRVGDGFAFGFGADSASLVGSFSGLAHDSGDACGWTMSDDPLVAKRVSDFTAHPTDSSITFMTVASASDGERTGIVQRKADGTLSPLGASDTGPDGTSRFFANRLRVAVKEDAALGLRFYETGLLVDAEGVGTTMVRYSDDGAETWVEHPVPGAGGSGQALIWGIDPSNVERILVSIQDPLGQGSEDQVLVSDDAGATLVPWIEDPVTEVSAVAIAADGRVWLGDGGTTEMYMPPQGLWYAPTLGEAPTKIGDREVRCLTFREQDERLFGCSLEQFGPMDANTGALSPTFTFEHATAFVECPGEDLAETCKDQLCDAWCGPTHYAQAPLCTAYDEPSCGPEADRTSSVQELPDVAPLDHVVDELCPHAADDQAPEPNDAGADNAGTNPDGAIDGGRPSDGAAGEGTDGGAHPATDSGPMPSGTTDGGGGGCAARPGRPHGTWLALGFAAFCLVAAARYRRRAPLER